MAIQWQIFITMYAITLSKTAGQSLWRNNRNNKNIKFLIGALNVPWNSMELLVLSKLTHFKSKLAPSRFHGIPWNSMEVLMSAKLAHPKFHGIPWNCSCNRNLRTPSSMEFHGTARVSEIGALEVPWNSLLVSAKLAHLKFHGIPWNSMELLVSSKSAHLKFHGIPLNSMELLVSSKLAHLKFHGIPWNCSCHRNWRTPSSMEFHGTAGVSSTEFHGTYCLFWNHWYHQYTEI